MTVNSNYYLQVNRESGATLTTGVVSQPDLKSKTIFPDNEVQYTSAVTGTSKENFTASTSQGAVDSLYQEIAGIVAELGISVKELKAKNVISQIAGNISEEQLLKNPEELSRIKECIKVAVRVIKLKKLDPTVANLVNYANDVNVATVTNAYKINEISESITLSEKSGSEKYVMDFAGIEKKIEDCYGKVTDFNKLSDEEKIKYINRFMNGYFMRDLAKNNKYTKKERVTMQLKQYVRLVANTEDPHNRALLINAIEALADANQYPAIKAWVTSFRNNEEKALMAQAATEDAQNAVLKNKTVTKEQAIEIKTEIAKYDTDEVAIQRIDDISNNREEFLKKNNIEKIKLLERKRELIIKKENNEILSEEEELFLEKYGSELSNHEQKVLAEYENTILASDTAINISYPQNKNLSQELAQELLQSNYENMQKYGNNYTEEVMQSVNDYVNNHKDSLDITVEELTKYLDEITNGEYSNYIETLNGVTDSPEGATSEAGVHSENNDNNSWANVNTLLGYGTTYTTESATEINTTVTNGQPAAESGVTNAAPEEKTISDNVSAPKEKQVEDICDCTTRQDVNSCIKTKGMQTLVVGFNNCMKLASSVLKYLQEYYSSLDVDSQFRVVTGGLSSDGFSSAEAYTKDGTFKELHVSGHVFANSAMTARVEKNYQKIVEDENRINWTV